LHARLRLAQIANLRLLREAGVTLVLPDRAPEQEGFNRRLT
jgi:hypothetical protein